MRKLLWALLALVPLLGTAGLMYAKSTTATKAGYICPITGEELPCPCCCPLNQN
jgi:hypothetical protein